MKPERKLTKLQAERLQRLCFIRGLASRPQGVTYKEIGYSINTVTQDVIKMVADGVLHRRTPNGNPAGKGARFFTDLAHADAYFSKTRPSKPAASKRVIGPAHLDIDPDFSNAKFTYGVAPVQVLRTNTHSVWG